MINFFNGKILLCLKVNKMGVGAEKAHDNAVKNGVTRLYSKAACLSR